MIARQEAQQKRTMVRERHIVGRPRWCCATCFRDNRAMSFRNIFTRYLVSHLRNYFGELYPVRVRTLLRLCSTVSAQNILPNSARIFPAKNKYSTSHDNVTSGETFHAQTHLVSSHPYRKTIRKHATVSL